MELGLSLNPNSRLLINISSTTGCRDGAWIISIVIICGEAHVDSLYPALIQFRVACESNKPYLAPHTHPISHRGCVTEGRWRGDDAKFGTASKFEYTKMVLVGQVAARTETWVASGGCI